jgi:hypothetical protein
MQTKKEKCQGATNETNFQVPPCPNGTKTEKQTANNEASQAAEIIKGIGSFEKIMIWANICIVILTCILAWANWNLAKDSKRQVEIAEKNMIVSNAPYFSIKGNTTPKLTTKYGVSFKLINVGKTPAINVRNIIICSIKTTDSADTMTTIKDSGDISCGIITPEGFSGITVISDVISGKRFFFLNIVYQYDDIFGHRYWGTECEKYDITYQRFVIHKNGNRFKQLY